MRQLGCGLKKQVTEGKEGPFELRRKKGKGNMPGGRKRGKDVGVLQRKKAFFISFFGFSFCVMSILRLC